MMDYGITNQHWRVNKNDSLEVGPTHTINI